MKKLIYYIVFVHVVLLNHLLIANQFEKKQCTHTTYKYKNINNSFKLKYKIKKVKYISELQIKDNSTTKNYIIENHNILSLIQDSDINNIKNCYGDVIFCKTNGISNFELIYSEAYKYGNMLYYESNESRGLIILKNCY